MSQLTFGLMSGVASVRPFAPGDVLMTKAFGRCVVLVVDENVNGKVFVCAKQNGTGECIVLEREVLYRSC